MSGRANVDTPPLMLDGIAVQSFGDPTKPAILFSAGLGGSGSYWAPQVEMLARDYRVILYDHRGTGRSARDPLPHPYLARHMADDIRHVLDSLDIDKAHLVGHAAGGVAALELARVHSGRLLTLTIVNGWAVADPHFVRCFDIRMAAFDAGGADAYLKAQPLFLYPASWISDHLVQLDEERAAHAPSFQDRATLQARIGALLHFDIRDHLATIPTQTLIVVSDDDMLVPPGSSTLLADGLPRATVAPMPWGGHAANVTDPERFNQILSAFLINHHGN